MIFNKSRKYNLGMTEEYWLRKQMKTEVVLNKNIIILIEEKEERQNSSAIPITIAWPQEQLLDTVQPHGTSEEYSENQEQLRLAVTEANRLSSSSTHTTGGLPSGIPEIQRSNLSVKEKPCTQYEGAILATEYVYKLANY